MYPWLPHKRRCRRWPSGNDLCPRHVVEALGDVQGIARRGRQSPPPFDAELAAEQRPGDAVPTTPHALCGARRHVRVRPGSRVLDPKRVEQFAALAVHPLTLVEPQSRRTPDAGRGGARHHRAMSPTQWNDVPQPG
jgi:hypothetical protein